MNALKKLMAVLMAALPLLAATGADAESRDPALAPVAEMEGTIQKLEIADNAMIFEGLRYHMAPELVVEIRGGPGAFTMLREGMKARIVYKLVSPTYRLVTRIEQLPDNYEVEQA